MGIFLSYAREDRPKAKIIADALTRCGKSVWWDPSIPPGKPWDEVIEEALDHAHCVVVLWSKTSIKSNWVRAEASEGLRRQILVPVMVDEAKIPLEFRRIQTVDLTDWEGDQDHVEFQRFVQSVSSLVPRDGGFQDSVPALTLESQEFTPEVLAARQESRGGGWIGVRSVVAIVLCVAMVGLIVGNLSGRLPQTTPEKEQQKAALTPPVPNAVSEDCNPNLPPAEGERRCKPTTTVARFMDCKDANLPPAEKERLCNSLEEWRKIRGTSP